VALRISGGDAFVGEVLTELPFSLLCGDDPAGNVAEPLGKPLVFPVLLMLHLSLVVFLDVQLTGGCDQIARKVPQWTVVGLICCRIEGNVSFG
jgi:hypothetical protein